MQRLWTKQIFLYIYLYQRLIQIIYRVERKVRSEKYTLKSLHCYKLVFRLIMIVIEIDTKTGNQLCAIPATEIIFFYEKQ